MFEESRLFHLLSIISRNHSFGKVVALLFSLFVVSSSSHPASITTYSSSTSNHLELLSNSTYRDFFLREYFLDKINSSYSSLIQSSIRTHHLITHLEQINVRRRRQIMNEPSFLTPVSTLHSINCSVRNSNQIQSTFLWSYSLDSISSIELIYQIHSMKMRKSSLPIRLTIKHSQTSVELFTITTSLKFDSLRQFYFVNISAHLLSINDRNFIIETLVDHQTCQSIQTHLIISSRTSDRFSSPSSSVDRQSSCQLKTIRVRFEDLGLAYLIIRPKEYRFSYCDGTCSNLTPQRSSLHGYLQSIIRQKHPNIPPLSCAPSQFADENFVLRKTDGTMETYPIKNLLVKQCHCL